MQRKTINAVITKKINEWLASIKDPAVVKQVKDNIIVTGGCITSMLLNEKVNDFDLYFRGKATAKAVAQYYCKVFTENNPDKKNKLGLPMSAWVLDGEDVEAWKAGTKRLDSFAEGYEHVVYDELCEWEKTATETQMADKDSEDEIKKQLAFAKVSGMIVNTPSDRIKVMLNSDGIAEDSDSIADQAEYDIDTYLDALADGDAIEGDIFDTATEDSGDSEKYRPIFMSTNAITLSNKIQLIVRFYGEPNEIHSNYDFVHATNYWDSKDKKVVLTLEALESIINKKLVYVGSKYPIASLVRTRKFIKRGWHIDAGQFVKMSFQIGELDLRNIYVLEDQLVGVDSIYFLNFINIMKERMLKDKSFVLTSDYLTTVIDRVFG